MKLRQPFRHTLPVSEATFKRPLYVTQAGWEAVLPNEDAYLSMEMDAAYYKFDEGQGRMLPDFCLTLVIEGSGYFQVGRRQGRLSAGDAFIYHPGEQHIHWPSRETGWTAFWILFSGTEPMHWMQDKLLDVRDNIAQVRNPALFRAQFEHLLESVHKNPLLNSINYSFQTYGLISHFLLDQPVSSRIDGAELLDDEVARAAREYIWNFSHGIIDVPAIAKEVGVPRRTLHRRFKAATGRSILDEIQYCRVSRAARLLHETELPLKYIVQRAGFRSEENMRLAFQKTFGRPPGAYRQSPPP